MPETGEEGGTVVAVSEGAPGLVSPWQSEERQEQQKPHAAKDSECYGQSESRRYQRCPEQPAKGTPPQGDRGAFSGSHVLFPIPQVVGD